MILDYKGKELPAFISIDYLVLNALIYSTFGRTYKFPKISCITEDVIPFYNKTPRKLTEYLNELCLRGKLKRGSYIIECQ